MKEKLKKKLQKKKNKVDPISFKFLINSESK